MFAVWEPAMLADSMARVRGIMDTKSKCRSRAKRARVRQNQTVVAVYIGDTCTC